MHVHCSSEGEHLVIACHIQISSDFPRPKRYIGSHVIISTNLSAGRGIIFPILNNTVGNWELTPRWIFHDTILIGAGRTMDRNIHEKIGAPGASCCITNCHILDFCIRSSNPYTKRQVAPHVYPRGITRTAIAGVFPGVICIHISIILTPIPMVCSRIRTIIQNNPIFCTAGNIWLRRKCDINPRGGSAYSRSWNCDGGKTRRCGFV